MYNRKQTWYDDLINDEGDIMDIPGPLCLVIAVIAGLLKAVYGR